MYIGKLCTYTNYLHRQDENYDLFTFTLSDSTLVPEFLSL